MKKWILKEKYNISWKIQYKDRIFGKICFNTFSPFQKKRKSTQKESNLAESTAIADATRFIVTFHRVLLWKIRGTAITRKDYILSRKGRINHSSIGNLTRKSIKVLDSTYWKENTSKNYYKNISNLKNKTLFNNNYNIIRDYIFCK